MNELEGVELNRMTLQKFENDDCVMYMYETMGLIVI